MASPQDKDKTESNRLLHKAIKEGDVDTVRRLLQKGASPNAVDPTDYGRTPLTNACKLGHLEIVKALLEWRARVNLKDRHKDPYGKDISEMPLSAACDCDKEDHETVALIAGLLISCGADVVAAHPKDRDGPLHLAAKHGHAELVAMLLLRGVDVNLKGSYGYTALHHATHYGRSLDLVKFLLVEGADVNLLNQQGANALHLLISGDQDNVDIARLLIEHGIKLASKSYGDVLAYAASWGKPKIVELLVARGLDVNAKCFYKDEPAIIAAMRNKHYDIVKMLLEHGADPDVEERYDGSLLRQAVKLGDHDLVKLILAKQHEKQAKQAKRKQPRKGAAKKAEKPGSQSKPNTTGALVEAAEKGDLAIVKLLLASGIDINEQMGSREGNPLMRAAAFGNLEVVQHLLEHGAAVSDRDGKGSTALLYAASTGEDAVVRFLLDHGARVTETNDLNWNALMQAVFKGHYSTAKLLLERGSPMDYVDQEKGATALWLAKHAGNAKMIELLQAHGAKDRPIRQRKSGEPYLAITDCDICAYLPPRTQLTYDYSPAATEGLQIVLKEETGEYKAEETEMIKKCIHCGTYYHHHHYIDTEDSIGGAGPVCSHHILRYNLLWLHDLLRKRGKVEELAEAQGRYQGIIDSFLRLVNAGHDFMPYVQPYVVESLVDYFVTAGDWVSINTLLLHNNQPAICVETVQDLLNVWGEKAQEESFPPFHVRRNFTREVQQKLKSMLRAHREELVAIIMQLKLEQDLDIAKTFVKKEK